MLALARKTFASGPRPKAQVDSKPVAEMYQAQAGDNSRGFSNIDLDPGSAATPTFLVCTTNYLVLNGRRNVDLKY